jgi:DNA-binding transcriptional ArsR family regulator
LSTILIPEVPLAVPTLSETKTPSTPPNIEKLRADLARWLSIPPEDGDVVDFTLGVYKSHDIPGDPLWGIIIDASGAGKTELLRAFRNRPDAYFLSNLTENTLVSGYRDPKSPDKDPSILPELNEKVLVIKDLAPLLGMRAEARSAVIAGLRDAYDGFTDQGRGNLGRISYEARFTLLAASTLAIERTDTVEQELGERFIKFRARSADSKDKVRKAISNIGADSPMRHYIEGAVSFYLSQLPKATNARVPAQLQEPLVELAIFTAKARSHVARDRNGVVQYLPRPEVGTRLGKELGKLLLALAVVRGKCEPDQSEFETVVRVAEDCIPPNRLAVLRALRFSDQVAASDIERATGLPHSTALRTLEDLEVLGLVESFPFGQFDLGRKWKLVTAWKAAP